MAHKVAVTVVAVVAVILTLTQPASCASAEWHMVPEVEITLANDGQHPVWFMCGMTEREQSLHELAPNSTYRFAFKHIAFPMRWCYLYISPRSHGFFWAYTVNSRCTKCFWSINRHPSLYRLDIGRWEHQKLFMPPGFNISDYMPTTVPKS